jgi:hypothetical protein
MIEMTLPSLCTWQPRLSELSEIYRHVICPTHILLVLELCESELLFQALYTLLLTYSS